jgi:hypothetical protein
MSVVGNNGTSFGLFQVREPYHCQGQSCYLMPHDAAGSRPRCRRHAVFVARSVDQQHELPAHVTTLAHPVRLSDLFEWEGLRDR